MNATDGTHAPSRSARIAVPAALFGLLAGTLIGYGAGRRSVDLPALPGSQGTYEEGFAAARKKVEEARTFPTLPSSATLLTGKVTAVGPSSLEIEVDLRTSNPFQDADVPAKRTVRITDRTELFRIAAKEQEAYRLEMQAAIDEAGDDLTKIRRVESFTLTPIETADIAVGATVMARADHDILRETSFDAIRIEVSR